eukprot:GDKI01046773.1.p1 GENE.GDKI01046773.1~~GDKI01046773.1.p1  ORF type:complete len:443 (-),score=159.44 GDKI01046773.1:331-1659(-)
MQGGKLSFFIGLLLVVAVQSSWIAGKKVHESIANVNDVPINFAALAVTVHAPTHATFATSALDTATVTAQLNAGLQSYGVRENEAMHIAEWAGSCGSFESRSFEFKYVDEVGQLLVKQILCRRQVEGGAITVTSTVSSALGVCPVHASKNVHHERMVTRRVIGIRVKRWVERWVTQEPRGLTRAEIDQLVDLMSVKVYEAIRASAPPTFQAAANFIQPNYMAAAERNGENGSPLDHLVNFRLDESDIKIIGSEDVPTDTKQLAVELGFVKHEYSDVTLDTFDEDTLTTMLKKQLGFLGVGERDAQHVAEQAVASLLDAPFKTHLREFEYLDATGVASLRLTEVIVKGKKEEGDAISVHAAVAIAAGTCPVSPRKKVHHEKTVTRRIGGVKVNSWQEQWTTVEARELSSQETDQLVDFMFGEVNGFINASRPKQVTAPKSLLQ